MFLLRILNSLQRIISKMRSIFTSYKNIISVLGKYKKSFRFGYLVAMIEHLAGFIPYLLVFHIISIYVERPLIINDFYIVSFLMAFSIIVRIIFKRLLDTLQQDKGYYAFSDARLKISKHLENLNMGFYSEGNIGNISSVVTTDIVFVEEFGISQTGVAISSIISIITSVVFLFIFDYRLTIIYVVLGLLSMLVLDKILLKQEALSRIRQDSLANLSTSLLDFVKGIQVIKAFNMKREKNADIEEKIEETKNNSLLMVKKMHLYLLSFEFITSISSAIMIILVSSFMLKGSFSISYGIGFIVFSFNIFIPITLLGLSSEMLSIANAGIDRYKKLINEKELENKKDSTRTAKTSNISFKDVSFAYESKDVIHNINLEIKEKSFTALVGKSGSGKTTIVNLLCRFWDISHGEILIDNINIKDISFENLLSNISMVFQRVYLFNDTIYNNIAFGSQNATKEDVIAVSKKARCHDFIMKLEKGYDTIVGEAGSSLSGGEKQRISIARAMLKDAKIILLDEATVGIDPENEKFIQDAIDELVKDKTLIVIAHRLSTIKNADNIVYLENGQIIEQGNHFQLLQKEGKYKRQFDFYMKNKSI